MTRIHHTNVRIQDAARSLAFYRTIGLEHTGTLSLGPGYTLLFMTDSAGIAIELVVNDTDDPNYDRSPGSGHLGFEVDDLDATLAELDTVLGTKAEVGPMVPGDRSDLRPVAFVRDPDGMRVELLQKPWPIPNDPLPAEFAALSRP